MTPDFTFHCSVFAKYRSEDLPSPWTRLNGKYDSRLPPELLVSQDLVRLEIYGRVNHLLFPVIEFVPSQSSMRLRSMKLPLLKRLTLQWVEIAGPTPNGVLRLSVRPLAVLPNRGEVSVAQIWTALDTAGVVAESPI